MSKKKKDKKGKKDKKDKQKKHKAEGNRLSKAGKNAAALGTALAGAVAAEGAQATLTRMVEKGAASDRLDTIRHTIKEAAGAVKNVAGVVHDALDNAGDSAGDAATALTDKAHDTTEDTQASLGKVVAEVVDTLKDVTVDAKTTLQQGKKHKA
jgi:ElaB/YqjD/DUF883 family membrane-anchored ribosome-binding protein